MNFTFYKSLFLLLHIYGYIQSDIVSAATIVAKNLAPVYSPM